MPYEMIWENRGLHRRHYGHTTDLEIVDCTYKTESSVYFGQLRYVILDFLGVTSLGIRSAIFLEELAAANSVAAQTNPNIKVAVVSTHPTIISLAETYIQHELAPYPMRIFSNLDDARDWVAVSLP